MLQHGSVHTASCMAICAVALSVTAAHIMATVLSHTSEFLLSLYCILSPAVFLCSVGSPSSVPHTEAD